MVEERAKRAVSKPRNHAVDPDNRVEGVETKDTHGAETREVPAKPSAGDAHTSAELLEKITGTAIDQQGRGSNAPRRRGRAETKVVEKIVYAPTRKRLPKSRVSRTTSFTVGGAEGYMTSGAHDDGELGEVFLKLGKQGSTLAGVMDAFSIAVSIGLQYGVPLETYVSKFTNLRFEPAGLTDDPDVRMAQSLMDYVWRRLALDYLSFETLRHRHLLGRGAPAPPRDGFLRALVEPAQRGRAPRRRSVELRRTPTRSRPRTAHGCRDPRGPGQAASRRRTPAPS